MKRSRTCATCVFAASFLVSSVLCASPDTIGTNGINSAGLVDSIGIPLTGAGIAIGQVEPGRPGMAGFDAANMLHPTVNPTDVFRQDGTANLADADDHAEQVAGIMISTDVMATGVATGASLYASADNGTAPFDPDSAITAQHVATRNGGDVRAINMSFGNQLEGGNTQFDGNSLLTQFVDWSAAEHDTLYVVAGNEGTTLPIPTDNFNGITVAASEKFGNVYRQVASFNTYDEDAEGDRTSIDLIAPGEDVRSTLLNNMLTPAPPQTPNDLIDDGTSFAAPHAVGTVALLQEFGDQQIGVGAPNWNVNARRHEVMKAVLMNSADKLIDNNTIIVPGGIPIPTGGLLGMERTVIKPLKTGQTAGQEDDWFDSNAWDDSFVDFTEGPGTAVPLDLEMGTGHLNASRALDQFSPGEHEEFGVNGDKVPVVGWDYGTTTGKDDINRYKINQELEAGSFISITLAWDRNVEFLVDANMDGDYDIGDTFEEYTQQSFEPPADHVINDLDLLLLPLGGTDFDVIALSSTTEGTLEHLFFQIPTTGEYEFWVTQLDEETFSTSQDYAVAWWALGTGPVIAGDFDGNGIVDAGDYTAWKDDFGMSVTPGTGADGNGNGLIDAADYTVWLDNLGSVVTGSTLVSETAALVPEPSTLGLFTALLLSLVCLQWRRQESRSTNKN